MADFFSSRSLADRPTRFMGGTRRRDEYPDEFRARMDSGRTMRGPMRGPTPLDLAAQRQQNVATAMANGTFDAKRNAYNEANPSKWMDENARIGPRAVSKDGAAPTPSPAKPAAPFTTRPAQAPSGTVTTDSRDPTARWQRDSASRAGDGVNTYPVQKTSLIASNYGTARSAPMTAQGSLKGATFEGKSRAEWFADATKRQGVNNAYSGDAVAEAQKAAQNKAPAVAAAPQPSTPPATKPAPAPAQAAPPPSLGHSPETIQKAIDTAGKQAGVTAPTSSAPGVRSMRGPMSVPSRNEVDLPSRGKASFAEGAQRATEHQQHINDLEQRAKNNLNAAQTQALKNPEGLSARFNPPGAQPKTLAEDPIAKPVIAAGKAIAPAIEATALTMGKTLNTQAAKNPDGVAAKVGRLLGAIPKQTGGGRLFSQNRTQR